MTRPVSQSVLPPETLPPNLLTDDGDPPVVDPFADPEALEDRALGAYLGLAIGDALGATVEFMTHREIEHRYGVHSRMVGGGWLNLAPGQVTDDTGMALALGRALISTGGFSPQAVADAFIAWLKSKPVDCGNTVRRGLRRAMTHGTLHAPYNDGDGGNGAAMRLAPVAIATLGAPDDEMIAWVLGQARITHHQRYSDAACVALVRMVHRALRGEGMAGVRAEANRLVETEKKFRFTPYRGYSSAYIIDTMQTVLHYYFSTDSLRGCIIETVNQGGDADTTGAIAGMVAGATHGASDLPSAWTRKLDKSVSAEIRAQTRALLMLAQRWRD
ncbi:ADP-ribosyl-[dinitrogen reductase] hydrolase [Roseospira marina]|uniref:ADP-ribosyl-[dinitrogen reductase] hydrolase n=1 Tax=Roseospira marina TaxID=140057 RepID=A0A5M6IH26_9PROT|nr:ADP-ribosyl-[dinitrogen reductase] hydrolase [Roseospira marina]KAA5607611.1 ADP-ribosyl-[dinitrogen reductase] hydrolase [Roseospira marina]MBB4312193.1 ADP-ribosyl-[dinitrogen reductase] hydrolase [Roseospira marina]MBB5085791.1 ADP-ribosyl-[dinitrogen reductase] hydrolase [Roseospira marina]